MDAYEDQSSGENELKIYIHKYNNVNISGSTAFSIRLLKIREASERSGGNCCESSGYIVGPDVWEKYLKKKPVRSE